MSYTEVHCQRVSTVSFINCNAFFPLANANINKQKWDSQVGI